ncbi:MAG: nicotinate-nucleotide--dimethylbenzimidazole phosphoribosyltransferase [Candidatus Rokubacteria bacterium]|nr:nicotinate-nucleotide--dimethylbenzimidazole phosphoribosyltransferase [Candidatus Rokubacteria bacterium]
MTLQEALSRIHPLDSALMRRARARLDSLTKPRGSLGRLEAVAAQVVAIHGGPRALERKVIFTLAADHGVTGEGVSAYPKVVTREMVENFCRGGAAINVLARQVGAKVVIVDIGVDGDLPALPGLVSRKVTHGTRNFADGPAMTREQAEQAIAIGIGLVDEESHDGLDLVGTGEMGIGNTTAASALTVVLTGHPAPTVTGRGTGIDDTTWKRKVAVIEQALAVNHPDARDPLDVLAKVGGFEIAGLVGVIVGAATHRITILVDGFISGAAALIAVALNPAVKDFLLASHCSAEPGHRAILSHLGLAPLLDLELRLGEGTGAALAMPLVEAALAVYREMATFKEAGVSEKTP